MANTPAPSSIKLVKAILLAGGLLSVVAAISDDQGSARWVHLVSGVLFLFNALALRHGHGNRARISALLAINAIVQAVAAVSSKHPMDLFGVVLLVALLALVNSPASRSWFSRGLAR